VIALAVALTLVSAQTRLAIVAGHNTGGEGRTPLRYAEADAARVKRALVEVSSVAAADVKLLEHPTLAQLEAAFAWAKGRVTKKTLLFIYLSAHGHDGKGIELGAEVLEWEKLKALVRGTGADVKLAIIDSCHASGVLKASGKPAEDFALKAEDRLTVEGEAWITSSAENEPSLEAGAWRGSVFTHHLVAGLRGAADRSADKKVSLEELYRYAFERTTAGESGQHPGYSFRLQGYGELDVSDPGRAAATLSIPQGLDAVTVTERETGENLAEARHPLGRVLGFGAARVDVRLLRGTQAFGTQLTLAEGDRVALDESQLERVNVTTAQLVRLSKCVDITVPRPDPRLNALKAKLQGTCDRPEKATLTRSPKGALKLELAGRTIEAADDEALIKAVAAP
jgi:hypothetical protein